MSYLSDQVESIRGQVEELEGELDEATDNVRTLEIQLQDLEEESDHLDQKGLHACLWALRRGDAAGDCWCAGGPDHSEICKELTMVFSITPPRQMFPDQNFFAMLRVGHSQY